MEKLVRFLLYDPCDTFMSSDVCLFVILSVLESLF